MFSFQRKFFFGLSEGILKISCHFMLSLKETSLVALTAVAVQSLNRVWLLRSHGLQLSRLPCPSLSPWVCSHLCAIQLSHPMLPPPPFALKLSQYQGLFQWVSSLHQVTKVLELEFQYQTGYFKEYSEFISFMIECFDLLVVKETLKSLPQHYNSKASILWHSVFSMVQLSHLYMTTGKTIALAIWTLVGKVMSLIFNTLSSFVIAFLRRVKCLFVSWLQSPFAGILETKKIKSVTASTFPHLFAMKWHWQCPVIIYLIRYQSCLSFLPKGPCRFN